MGIGDNIKLYRKKANFTQRALAEKYGYATGTIQQYELGKREPRAEQLKRIAEQKPGEQSPGFIGQRYQDSNLENAGVRVQCLTVWR